MAYEGQLVLYRRRCGNPGCPVTFWICTACDRRRRYCGRPCRSQARALRHRQANRRYQGSQLGRRQHSARQSRYRARQRLEKNKVKDRDSPTGGTGSMLDPWIDPNSKLGEPAAEAMPSTVAPRCIQCGRLGVAAATPVRNGSDTMMTPETQPCPAEATAKCRNASTYVTWVLDMYLKMPGTPAQTTAPDRQQAQRLFARGVPAEIVETALLLASLRRLVRDRSAGALPCIRSLAYFMPVIEELLLQPVRRGYVDYLRRKLHELTRPSGQSAAQVRP